MTDGFIGAVHVVIDSARNGDGRNAQFRKDFGAFDGAVPAYDDEAVDASMLQRFCRFDLVFFFQEFLASGRFQHGAAMEDNAAHGGGFHADEVIVQKSCIASVYSINLASKRQGCPYDRPYGRIHARRISAACEHS